MAGRRGPEPLAAAGPDGDVPGSMEIDELLNALGDEDVALGELAATSGARRQAAAFDDDMSDDDGDGHEGAEDVRELACASSSQPAAKAAEVAGHRGLQGRPVAVQIAAHRSKVAQLQALKQKLLEEEEFIEAHEVNQRIKEEEDALAAARVRMCAPLPTPARAGTPAAVAPMGAGGAKADIPSATSTAAAGVEAQGPAAPVDGASEADGESDGDGPPSAAEEPPADSGAGKAADGAGSVAAAPEGQPQVQAPPRWRQSSSSEDLVELASDPRFVLPRAIFERLFDHQQEGVAWLAGLWLKGQGGVLADEMGLGKTVQVCALLNGARKAGATHALVLLPVTLLDQWAREAKTWCPGWPVYTFYGTQTQRADALRGLSRPQGGVLLTSYTVLSNAEQLLQVAVAEGPRRPGPRRGRKPAKRMRREQEASQEGGEAAEEDEAEDAEMPAGSDLPKPGETRAWDLVVCDEAHRMKSVSSLLSKSLRRLRSRCRILLTGTPVQNALQDLWSLMDFAQPSLLGNHATFVKHFSDPIDRGSVRGASAAALALKNHLAEQLRGLIAPHLLRRTKAGSGLVVEGESSAADGDQPLDIGDAFAEAQMAQFKALPPKRETIIWLIPSEEQLLIYKKVLEKSEIIREAAAKGKMSIEAFKAIGLLKRLCNHPLMVLPMSKPGAWKEVLAEATDSLPETAAPEDKVEPTDAAPEELPDEGLSRGADAAAADDARAGRAAETLARQLPRSADALLAQSAKLRCLALLLPALASRGHRTLVFSQSVKMLDLIQICVLRPHGLKCLRIDGQTDPQARAEKVEKFQRHRDRFQCMLLTTAVGGVGLNLTAADRVVVVDPAWNPATDAQAVDRACRIGQEKEVRTYRLVTSGLIEDKMFRLQVFKMGLTKTALEGDQHQHLFTSKEIRALFEFTDPAQGETRALLAASQAEADDSAAAAAQKSADDDGGTSDGWLGDWLAAGLSDFSAFTRDLASARANELGGAAPLERTIAEAKEKLDNVEAHTRTVQEARKAVEEKRAAAVQGLAEAAAGVSAAVGARCEAEEALKEARGALAAVRRAEGAAALHLQKALRAQMQAQDSKAGKAHQLKLVEPAATTASRAAEEARAAARRAEDELSAAVDEVSVLLSADAWDDGGKAIARGAGAQCGPADVSADKLRCARRALGRVRGALDTAAIRQSEAEDVEDELLALYGGYGQAGEGSGASASAPSGQPAPPTEKERERMRTKLEQTQGRAQDRAQSARDAASAAVAALLEAGLALADSFEKTSQRAAKMEEVRAAHARAKAAFRQLSAAWTTSRRAQEGWVKAAAARAKQAERVASAREALGEVEAAAAEAEKEAAAASKAAEERRQEVSAAEARLKEASDARDEAEAEELRWKRRREELKEEAATARVELKTTSGVVKEATAQRKAVLAEFSRVEKVQLKVEAAKACALQRLRTEKYDVNQVELAYESKRRGAGAASQSQPQAADGEGEGAAEEDGSAGGTSPGKRLRGKTSPQDASPSGGSATPPAKRLRSKTPAEAVETRAA